jgi:AcrR family transcriptional regulator
MSAEMKQPATANSRLHARKRPLQRRSAATVSVMLEAAARILEQQGLAGFNTNLVAQRAGVSIGSLYQYFPGKEALLAALIRDARSDLLASVQQVCDQSGLLETRLQALIRAAVAHQLQRPHLMRHLEYAELMLPLDQETNALNQALQQAVQDLLLKHGTPNATTAAQDLIALSRGMIDSAGLAGETDAAALEQRVWRAVRGYLSVE